MKIKDIINESNENLEDQLYDLMMDESKPYYGRMLKVIKRVADLEGGAEIIKEIYASYPDFAKEQERKVWKSLVAEFPQDYRNDKNNFKIKHKRDFNNLIHDALRNSRPGEKVTDYICDEIGIRDWHDVQLANYPESFISEKGIDSEYFEDIYDDAISELNGSSN